MIMLIVAVVFIALLLWACLVMASKWDDLDGL